MRTKPTFALFLSAAAALAGSSADSPAQLAAPALETGPVEPAATPEDGKKRGFKPIRLIGKLIPGGKEKEPSPVETPSPFINETIPPPPIPNAPVAPPEAAVITAEPPMKRDEEPGILGSVAGAVGRIIPGGKEKEPSPVETPSLSINEAIPPPPIPNPPGAPPEVSVVTAEPPMKRDEEPGILGSVAGVVGKIIPGGRSEPNAGLAEEKEKDRGGLLGKLKNRVDEEPGPMIQPVSNPFPVTSPAPPAVQPTQQGQVGALTLSNRQPSPPTQVMTIPVAPGSKPIEVTPAAAAATRATVASEPPPIPKPASVSKPDPLPEPPAAAPPTAPISATAQESPKTSPEPAANVAWATDSPAGPDISKAIQALQAPESPNPPKAEPEPVSVSVATPKAEPVPEPTPPPAPIPAAAATKTEPTITASDETHFVVVRDGVEAPASTLDGKKGVLPAGTVLRFLGTEEKTVRARLANGTEVRLEAWLVRDAKFDEAVKFIQSGG